MWLSNSWEVEWILPGKEQKSDTVSHLTSSWKGDSRYCGQSETRYMAARVRRALLTAILEPHNWAVVSNLHWRGQHSNSHRVILANISERPLHIIDIITRNNRAVNQNSSGRYSYVVAEDAADILRSLPWHVDFVWLDKCGSQIPGKWNGSCPAKNKKKREGVEWVPQAVFFG